MDVLGSYIPRPRDGKGTVALVIDHGHDYFGVNSARRTAAEQTLVRGYYDEMRAAGAFSAYNVVNYGFGRSSFLTHAEAEAILEDYHANHNVTSGMTAYVDRETCPPCVNNLPILLRYLHVTQITFLSKNGVSHPIGDTPPQGTTPSQPDTSEGQE